MRQQHNSACLQPLSHRVQVMGTTVLDTGHALAYNSKEIIPDRRIEGEYPLSGEPR